MRADYLQRFTDLFHGGFSRLQTQGAVFPQAYVPYALSMTAPGHASIATGLFPAEHGVIQNHWFDRRQKTLVYAVADSNESILHGSPTPKTDNATKGLSPRALLKPSLGDQLKGHSSQSKVFSLALKDRAAILLGGKHPDGVYWYNAKDGTFVTSSYYRQALPVWLVHFNQSGTILNHFKSGWSRLLEPSAYARAGNDQVAAEAYGPNSVFPYIFDDGTADAKQRYYEVIRVTPFGDELAFELAEELIRREQLGIDSNPDLLFFSCTSADLIGHAFGPDSHELADYYLRLDRYLADFLQFLDQQVGENSYTFVLTSDHGVVPLPEEQSRREGKHYRRITLEEMSRTVSQVLAKLAKQLHLPSAILLHVSDEGIWLDTDLAKSHGVDAQTLRAAVAQTLQQKIPYIAEALPADQLERPILKTEKASPWLEMYRRSFHAERSPDILLRYHPYDLIGSESHGTAHGSPYEYDVHVPLIFLGKNISPGVHSERAEIIDIAPTLAELLGFSLSETQGQSLARFVRSQSIGVHSP